MKECNQAQNLARYTCTYEPCNRKELCCDCIMHHKRYGELPGGLFQPEVERTYDRSIARFVSIHK